MIWNVGLMLSLAKDQENEGGVGSLQLWDLTGKIKVNKVCYAYLSLGVFSTDKIDSLVIVFL